MGITNYYATMKSPLGEIALTSSGGGITGLYISSQADCTKAKNGTRDQKFFQKAIQQLKEYFKGERRKFDLPLSAAGTGFQKSVWNALRGIEYGETKSYGEVAKALKRPNASRAVGLANSKNPVCIIVPCHRVIGANGSLTGYAGGLKAKQWLLNHEAKRKRANDK